MPPIQHAAAADQGIPPVAFAPALLPLEAPGTQRLRAAIAVTELAGRAVHIPMPRDITPDHLANIVRRFTILCGLRAAAEDVDIQTIEDVGALLAQLRAHEHRLFEFERLTRIPDVGELDDAEYRTHEALHAVWEERRSLDAAGGGASATQAAADACPPLEWTHKRAALECLLNDALDTAMTEEEMHAALHTVRGAVRRIAALAVEQLESIDRALADAGTSRTNPLTHP